MKESKALYGPAMSIHDQAEADAYFDALVTYRIENDSLTRAEAEALERAQLGYYAGYYDHETRRRVEKLYRCEHPYLGSIEKNGPPTPEQALGIGYAMGKRIRNKAKAAARKEREMKPGPTVCPECSYPIARREDEEVSSIALAQKKEQLVRMALEMSPREMRDIAAEVVLTQSYQQRHGRPITPGDLWLCQNCGEILVFTSTLGVRMSTVAERSELPQFVFDEVAQIVTRGRRA